MVLLVNVEKSTTDVRQKITLNIKKTLLKRFVTTLHSVTKEERKVLRRFFCKTACLKTIQVNFIKFYQ